MKRVTCFGTGLIGVGWGVDFLKGGCEVTFYDIDQEKLDAARGGVKSILSFLSFKGLITEEQVQDCLSRAHYTADVAEAVAKAELIQENGPENLELKHEIIKAIEAHCPADAIIASSTSGLLISDIAAKATHPERIIGGHPYNPVYVMPLVEISKGEKTEQRYADMAKAFYTELGKEPVILNKESLGFICNRIQIAVLREAYDLVHRGVCSVEDVDKAVTFGVGLRWAILGPHLINQLGGGAEGFKGLYNRLSGTVNLWLEDMATWTKCPEDYPDIAVEGIAAEMANRAPGTGQNALELGAYLNNGILELLRFHGKI